MSLLRGGPSASATQLSQTAIRRLQRDLQAWERDRAELHIPVALKFADNDLSRLYINFRPDQGPHKDAPIHIHAIFPPDYPNSPPDVRMMTPGFIHPNVFEGWLGQTSDEGGAYICLDMIKPPEHYARPYGGWSAAYDISGLVLQLYSFLIGDDHIDQDYGRSVSRADYNTSGRHISNLRRGLVGQQQGQQEQQDAQFKCRCGFTELPAVRPVAMAAPPLAAAAASPPPVGVPELPNDILGLIISRSDPGTVTRIAEARTAKGGGAAAAAPAAAAAGGGAAAGSAAAGGFTADVDDPLADVALRVKQGRELLCFYHKTPAAGSAADAAAGFSCRDADGDVLGFGVAVVRHRDGSLKSLSMAMDLLSYRAFDTGGVRRSAWNVPFDAFIPLALNAHHAVGAMRLLPRCVARMLGRGSAGVTEAGVLDVMARLMNSLVVEMVMVGGGGAATVVSRHMSDTALKGFCHLHHLLLTVVLSDGGGALVARCSRDVLAFLGGAGGAAPASHKSRCPDLGLLLIKYMLVPKDVVPWWAFAPAFVREMLARHVMWVARGLGGGGGAGAAAASTAFLAPWRNAETAAESDVWRLQTHLQHSRTSLMTVAIEAFFVNALARPAGGGAAAATAAASGAVLDQLAAIKATYDKRNGEPPAAVFDAFSAHARSVQSMGKWSEALVALRLGLAPPPPRPDGGPTTVGDMARRMADVLRQAVLDSRRAGYHTDPPLAAAATRVAAPGGPVIRMAVASPTQYVDWEGSPPVGVGSDEWR